MASFKKSLLKTESKRISGQSQEVIRVPSIYVSKREGQARYIRSQMRVDSEPSL